VLSKLEMSTFLVRFQNWKCLPYLVMGVFFVSLAHVCLEMKGLDAQVCQSVSGCASNVISLWTIDYALLHQECESVSQNFECASVSGNLIMPCTSAT
jgi:hypothetical protein